MSKTSNVILTGCLGAMALLLSACGGGKSDLLAEQRPSECALVEAADGPGSGTAASHGQPQRNDGAVSVDQQGGQFRARKLVSIANDFGGASTAQVDFSSQNGDVISCPRQGGGYRIKLMLEARAASEADARSALDSILVNHTDTLAATMLRLNTQVQFSQSTSTGAVTLPTTGSGSNSGTPQRGATIIAGLPASASYAFTHSSSNGSVRTVNLSGSSATLSTTNGNLGLNQRWDSATLNGSNGSNGSNGIVSMEGDYASIKANTSNGVVEAHLQTGRSLSASFSTTNGYADIQLAQSAAGFDVQAQTTNGTARIDVAGTDPVGPQSSTAMHRRTSDYSTRAVKVQVSASATNGDARIQQ